MKNIITSLLWLSSFVALSAQTGSINGIIWSQQTPLEFVAISLDTQELGSLSNAQGQYTISKIPFGTYTLSVHYLGYQSIKKTVLLEAKNPILELNFDLIENNFTTDQIVITGTKTFKRQTQSAVIVNVIDSKTLDRVQACNLSEGLKFQTGLRVETDCQTCNYTQLRMNGLGGGYSQILLNGRPIFSPLTGLYGLEQIPSNMIEKIEVVRGGGSALYGSSAIGGTVNVITKIPKKNNFNLGLTYQNINSRASDFLLSGNATILAPKGKAGATLFIHYRDREYYDHNGDNFSELPMLKNSSWGTNLFLLPSPNQKIELNFSYLNEYRYGGEMVKKAPHLALQSEERTHYVWLGNLDYQINFNQNNSSFIAYLAAQSTDREHYTGIFPNDSLGQIAHLVAPPYGYSKVSTLHAGTQLNHRFKKFLTGENCFTFGLEYSYDKVLDEIKSYHYLIAQQTTNLGAFLQTDWEVLPKLNLLAGLRADKHNLVNKIIFSPRVSILYKPFSNTQFRLSWGTGFRAPQSFDTDLHIAFAGGGVSRVKLSPQLQAETSNSLSGSINFDKATEKYIFGFTLEGFYTQLQNVFYQQPIGRDNFGQIFEKRNGKGATVLGSTLELRLNYNQKWQLETGLTYQSSRYENAIFYTNDLPSKQKFLRTPDWYGFAILSIMPFDNFSTTINLVYTGQMELIHWAGTAEQVKDTYVQTPIFAEVNLKMSYTIRLKKLNLDFKLSAGIKNIFDSYQNDFDSGRYRDSNYIYGTAAPRTFFLGLDFSF